METAETFFDAYVTAALWSSLDESTPSGGEPMDANYTSGDIAPETLAKMEMDCNQFLADWQPRLNRAMFLDAPGGSPYSMAMAGHDFWLTRNGHGAGFWDRGLGETGEKLTTAAISFGEYNLYVGDDGQIYGN